MFFLASTGVPNTLNVMTNFPFLVVGVLGFVLALEGTVFNIRFSIPTIVSNKID